MKISVEIVQIVVAEMLGIATTTTTTTTTDYFLRRHRASFGFSFETIAFIWNTMDSKGILPPKSKIEHFLCFCYQDCVLRCTLASCARLWKRASTPSCVKTGSGNATRAMRSPNARSSPSGSRPVARHFPAGMEHSTSA